jgi:hypothetical protein
VSELAIPHVCLKGSPWLTVARVAQGITFYLDEPLIWAQQAASEMLRFFLKRAPVDSLRWFTTSALPDWHKVGVNSAHALADHLSLWTLNRPRHLFSFRLVDDNFAPSLAFSYREIDTARVPRTGVLEVVWPESHDSQELFQFAIEVADKWPFLSAVGGYVAVWNPHEKATAFWSAYEWCRRYLGLDVQDADAMAYRATTFLPGANWLTLIGNSLAAARSIDPSVLAAHVWKNPIKVIPMAHGVLLRAGELPTLGDRNRLEYPAAYAEVARHLTAHIVVEPPEYYGGFAEHKNTVKWIRRFIEPEGWI